MTRQLEPALSKPKVAILLCTYDGQHYLSEQLDSFAMQSHSNWDVWVSDDGSKDRTHEILEDYKKNWPAGTLSVDPGPARGCGANFLTLTCNAGIQADYYAYSDQDDIWDEDKLERAVRWLEAIPAGTPALYGARTRLVDDRGTEIGMSPLFSKPPCFANALIQNIAGGNTMVFNTAARALLREAGEKLPVVMHDWWTYIAVTGCGGKVYYDAEPSLRYRQHTSNLVGLNSGWAARLRRVHKLWRGEHREWNGASIAALHKLEGRLTPENREILKRFVNAREMGLLPRLINFARSGVHRQTLLGNAGLYAAVIFKRI